MYKHYIIICLFLMTMVCSTVMSMFKLSNYPNEFNPMSTEKWIENCYNALRKKPKLKLIDCLRARNLVMANLLEQINNKKINKQYNFESIEELAKAEIKGHDSKLESENILVYKSLLLFYSTYKNTFGELQSMVQIKKRFLTDDLYIKEQYYVDRNIEKWSSEYKELQNKSNTINQNLTDLLSSNELEKSVMTEITHLNDILARIKALEAGRAMLKEGRLVVHQFEQEQLLKEREVEIDTLQNRLLQYQQIEELEPQQLKKQKRNYQQMQYRQVQDKLSEQEQLLQEGEQIDDALLQYQRDFYLSELVEDEGTRPDLRT